MIEEVAKSPSRPRTYLVNPRYREIGGVPCHPSLSALPEPVDLALLAVPDSALEGQVSAAAASGAARSAVIFGSAAAGGLPVLLLTAGTSAASRSLVAAHSGALAAGDGAWQALASAYGVHRVSDLAELADTLELFSVTRTNRSREADGLPPAGQGLATVHDSGFERAERAVALPPLTSASTRRMLDGLRFAELLGGVRGQPPCDAAAVTSAITAFSALVADLAEHLAAFDINPLICTPAGVLAVDALVIPATTSWCCAWQRSSRP